MWERAYAVCETKRYVEGAAGTRGADKTIVEAPFVDFRAAIKKIKRKDKKCLLDKSGNAVYISTIIE